MKPDGVSDKLWSVCVHEAGHQTVAEYYGLSAESVATESQGLCVHEETSLWNKAVVAWGGWVAEALVTGSLRDFGAMPVALTAGTAREWAAYVAGLCRDWRNEPDDWRGVSHGGEIAATCEAARSVLSPRLGYVRALAKMLAADAESRGPADDADAVRQFQREVDAAYAKARYEKLERELLADPVRAPSSYPASPADFLRLVVADDGPVTHEHCAQMNQFAVAVTARSGVYLFQQDFTSASEWRHYAREFQKWRDERAKETTQR